eukprot:SAG22_NODE_2001_length_3168_cov_24.284132_3_plen_215_part_00
MVTVKQSNVGQRNMNLNINNKVFVSRQRPNLREVRRALPGSKALQGYSRYGIPELHTQSALLTNNMMSQLNNFRREVEQGQRDLQAQQQAFQQAMQRQQQAAVVAGVAPPQPPQAPPQAQQQAQPPPQQAQPPPQQPPGHMGPAPPPVPMAAIVNAGAAANPNVERLSPAQVTPLRGGVGDYLGQLAAGGDPFQPQNRQLLRTPAGQRQLFERE